jgi:hypothetical protein
MNYSLRFKSLLALGCLLAAFSQAAAAAEVGGIKFDESVRVANKELKLNGAGLRVKLAFFNLYAAAMYLPEKKMVPHDILALPGPKRIMLVMRREIDADTFGDAFLKGLNDNSNKAELSKIIGQTGTFGELFAAMPGLKKGDVLLLDWLPGIGTQSTLNGKIMGAPLPDVAFFNAVLKIWIGEKPVDSSLKPQLLGEKS